MQSLRPLWSMLCAGALAAFVPTAHSIVIVSDGFPYGDGNLIGQNGGTSLDVNNRWSTAWTNAPSGSTADWQIVDGEAVTVGSVDDPSYARRSFIEDQGLTTYYFGFSLFIPAVAEIPSFVGLTLTQHPDPFTSEDAAVYTQFSGTNLFLRASIGNTGSVPGSTPLSLGTQYRIVTRLQFDGTTGDNTVLTTWVAPITNHMTEGSTPYLVNSNNTQVLGTTMGNNNLHMFRESVNSSLYRIDDFILATTFVEALPEPSAAAMVCLGLAGLLLRRRR